MAVKGARRNGVRGSRGKDQPDFLRRITDSFAAFCCRYFSRTRRYRHPIEYVSRSRSLAFKAFLATAFFNAGVCDDTWFYDFIGNSMIRGLGNRRSCMSKVRGMGLHRIKNSEV